MQNICIQCGIYSVRHDFNFDFFYISFNHQKYLFEILKLQTTIKTVKAAVKTVELVKPSQPVYYIYFGCVQDLILHVTDLVY